MEVAVFDFDGSMVDSTEFWNRLAYDYLKKEGFEPREEIYKEVSSLNLGEAAQYIVEKFNMERTSEEVLLDFEALIGSYYLEEVRLKPGLEDCLKKLYARGWTLVIASQSSRKLILDFLRERELMAYFSHVETEESLLRAKTSLEFFQELLAILPEEASRIYLFEDSPRSLELGKELGFTNIGLRDLSNIDRREELFRYSDLLIDDYYDLGDDIL